MDEQDVQPTGVSAGTSVEEGKVLPALPSIQPLSTEAIQEMINKGITEGIERAKQSARDTARFEVESLRRNVAQTKVHSEAALRQLEQHDPAEALRLRQAQFAAEVNQRQMGEQELQREAQHAEFVRTFIDTMTDMVTEMGIDPKDPRIDWGNDAPGALEAQKRIQKSAGAILRERQKAEKAAKEEISSREANSVTTGIPVAAQNTSGIPTDLAKFREWLDKIPQEEYEKTYATKVKELMRQGKIK